MTFLKARSKKKLTVPFQPEGRDYSIVAMDDRTICSVIDLEGAKTPDLMSWLDKEFGKEITTRTLSTVERILKKFDAG